MTMRTVLATTLWTPPPRIGSAITGRVSLTIMFANSKVTSSKWPFLRIGWTFLAYAFCFLFTGNRSGLTSNCGVCKGTHSVPLILKT